ncbi:MAG TPA: GTP cyclohydrolase FolE2 [bacterium]|nr:GTP cyclohydrolase FolE2 [bacterium]
MKDIQNQRDDRGLPVDMVGVSAIRYPITVKDKLRGMQETVAAVSMSVELLPEFKGTHMSRFIEILNRYRGEITMGNIRDILKETRESLGSPKAMMSLEFPYFIEKKSPVSEARSLFPVDVLFDGYGDGNGTSFILGIRVPVTTLCPCSQEISEFGAHNQRSYITAYLSFDHFIWLEDIVDRLEDCASSEIYPLLKRPDEKYVTEKAFTRPRFAEDIVRGAAELLLAEPHIHWFMAEATHLESIHTHNAYARIERFRDKRPILTAHLQVFKGFRQRTGTY